MSAAQIAGQPFQLEWVQGHAIGNVYWAFLAASPNEFTLLANNDSPADLDAYIDAAPSNQQAPPSVGQRQFTRQLTNNLAYTGYQTGI
jgi:hypothetical protein